MMKIFVHVAVITKSGTVAIVFAAFNLDRLHEKVFLWAADQCDDDFSEVVSTHMQGIEIFFKKNGDYKLYVGGVYP